MQFAIGHSIFASYAEAHLLEVCHTMDNAASGQKFSLPIDTARIEIAQEDEAGPPNS